MATLRLITCMWAVYQHLNHEPQTRRKLLNKKELRRKNLFGRTRNSGSYPHSGQIGFTLFVKSCTPITRLIFEALAARLKRATLFVMGASHAHPSLLCGW